MSKILYFGYGANRTLEMMQAITGKKKLKGYPGVLKGYKLYIQKLAQIPTTVVPAFPKPESLQEIIRKHWGENFQAYVIKPGKGEVSGTIWEIDKKDRQFIKVWERVGPWYREIRAKASTDTGTVNVATEALKQGLKVDKEVDGLDYPPFLVSKELYIKMAEHARNQYLKRIKRNGK